MERSGPEHERLTELVKTRYTVHTVLGTQYVWEGNLDELGNPDGEDPEPHVTSMLLKCLGGTYVNFAHVVALIPQG